MCKILKIFSTITGRLKQRRRTQQVRGRSNRAHFILHEAYNLPSTSGHHSVLYKADTRDNTEVVSSSLMLSCLPSRCPATAPPNFPFTTYSFALWGLTAGSTHGCATACILFNLISFINILSLAVVIHWCIVWTTCAIMYCWYEKHIWCVFFYVLLTVHLSIFILVTNQLDAQNLSYNKFISCFYMFRAPCAHRQEVKIVLYSLWYHHTYRWPSRAQVESSLNLRTGRPPIGVMIPEAV